MGLALVQQMLPILAKMKWPSNTQPTLAGHKTFEVGVDKVDDYHGDPKELGAALRTFQTADSRPYALAGAAYTLLAASRNDDGSYVQEGLDASLSLLEQAQETAPDVADINMIEAHIYVYSNRLDDARLVLNYLQGQDPHNYYIHRAELAYWIAQDDLDQSIRWCKKTMSVAKELPQRLRLQSIMGDLYARQGATQMALQAYQKAAHFDPENPIIWNKIAEAYFELDNLKEASRYNERALAMKRFPAAMETRARIQSRLETTGNLRDRLFRS
jgi:tetratricopeptide (TPR) repeat protein